MSTIAGLPTDHSQAIGILSQLIQQHPDLAELYYELGNRIQQCSAQMFSLDAIGLWQKAFELKPDWHQVYPEWAIALRQIAGFVTHELDDPSQGLEIIRQMILIERDSIQRHPIGKRGIRILSSVNIPQGFGHTCLEIDLMLKMQKLGWLENFTPLLLCSGAISNPHLLKYWGEYIEVVTDERQVQQLLPLSGVLRHETFYNIMPDGQVKTSIGAMADVQKVWEQQGREPLLHLTSVDYERGWEVLRQMGIPQGSWFVCLHVRESGYYREDQNTPTGRFRNAEIETYYQAIEAITSRGGWVIRMGDSSMKPLSKLPQTIDYANSPYKSDWMDIVLCAQCRFFLGTTSGLMNLASIFGVPCALTNWIGALSLPCFPADRFIYKRLFSQTENRYLKFEEFVNPPYAFATDTKLFELGVRPEDNSPQDILDLVLEMLDCVEGHHVLSPEEFALQGRARLIFDSKFCTGSACKIGQKFLEKNQSLFPMVL